MKKIDKWNDIRAKGKWNYILIYGVLGLGVSTGILFSFVFPLVMSSNGMKLSFFTVFAYSIIGFPIGGMAWGYSMWIYMEKAYLEAKASK